MIDLLLLLIIALCIYWAIRTLRRSGSHPCSSCRSRCRGCDGNCGLSR